jgi:hypothetical protein
MAVKKSVRKKTYYTVAEANATLPLIRAIVQDITQLAQDLRERHERLSRVNSADRRGRSSAYQEEVEQMQAEFERDQARMQEYEQELRNLGIELKDHYTGLVDFPCRMNDREVYLCWRLGEPQVDHWHELNAGFSGRQKLDVRQN